MIIARENMVRLLNPQIETQKQDLKELITKGFSFTDQQIILLYYYDGMAMKEIGTTLGISESRVCQMHASIMARLEVLMDQREPILNSEGSCERDRKIL